jgi:hypothetical protein
MIMKRKKLIALLPAAALLFLGCQTLKIPLAKELGAIARQIEASLPDLPPDHKVWVATFESPSERFSLHIIQTLEAELTNGRKLTIVTRSQLAADLVGRETNFQYSGHTNESDVLALDENFPAKIVIYGSLSEYRNGLRLNFNVVDMRTSQNFFQPWFIARRSADVDYLLEPSPEDQRLAELAQTRGRTRENPIIVPPNTALTGSSLVAGQHIWFKITAETSGSHTFETAGALDTVATLYDANGNRLVSDNDSGTGENAKITFHGDSGQFYLVQIQGINPQVQGQFQYRATGPQPPVQPQRTTTPTPPPPPPPPPPTEARQSVAGAITAAAGESYQRYFNDSSRTHTYRVDVPRNMAALTVYTEGGLDTKITAFSGADMNASNNTVSGVEIASDDDSGGGYNARLTVTVPSASRTLFFVVTEYGNRNGTYTFTVLGANGTPPRVVDVSYDTDPVIVEAGKTYRRSFSSASRRHLFMITIPDDVSALTLYTEGSLDTKITAVTVDGLPGLMQGQEPSGGNLLGSDDDGGTDRNARLTVTAPSGNRLIGFAITEFRNQNGSYTLTVQR